MTDETSGPVDPCTIVVFGEDPASWTWISTSIRTQQIATSKFTVRGLREGRYRVVAIPSYIPVPIAPPDVEFLEALKKVATPVFLNQGEKRVVELRLIRFDQ